MNNRALFERFKDKSNDELYAIDRDLASEISKLDNQRAKIEESIATHRRLIAQILIVLSIRKDIELGIDPFIENTQL